MKISDNFLEKETFRYLQGNMIGEHYPFGTAAPALAWYYNDVIDDPNEEKNKFQFTHSFFDQEPKSPFYHDFSLIFQVITGKNVKLARIKANLLTRTTKIIENKFHTDYGVTNNENNNCFTAIFYVNTNNGYTKFEDGTKVESVANRLVTFPTHIKHKGTSCTDEKIRVVINFNYITL
jgi:hypothetical protein